MTESAGPGWYDDPNRPNEKRWWDGSSWTEHFRDVRPDGGFDNRPPAPKTAPAQVQAEAKADAPASTASKEVAYKRNWFEQYMEALKEKVWLRWVSGIVIFIVFAMVASAFESPESETSTSSQSASAPAPEAESSDAGGDAGAQESPESAPPAKPKSLSSKERVRAALEEVDAPVEDPVIEDVEFGRDELTVTAKTPEGGVEGASTGDLNEQAAAIFQAVYGEAKYKKTDTVIVFKGGLVNSRTGKPVEDVNTGIYTMPRSDAREIDWSDQDTLDVVIDWSLFRDFAHPALKKDE